MYMSLLGPFMYTKLTETKKIFNITNAANVSTILNFAKTAKTTWN